MNATLANSLPRQDAAIMLGIPVDNLDTGNALNRIMKMVDDSRKDGKKRLVATANVDFIVNAHDKKDAEKPDSLMSILRHADMVTADGMPLVWLSKMLGKPLKERVTGADMVPALAEKAAKEGKSIYLFGGQGNSAKRTAEILKERYPDLKIAGYSAPFIDMEDKIENKIEIARINITEPDILLIALGNPKQEVWFNRYKRYLRVPVSMGIGGTFEFISGKTNRAPRWMQKTGLEWIYRMTQDPKRLVKRYAKGLYVFNKLAGPLVLLNAASRLVKRFTRTDVNLQTLSRNGNGIHQVVPGMTPMRELDMSRVKALLASDVLDIVNLIQKAEQSNYMIHFSNLKWLPRLTLKAYQVYDLVNAAKTMMVQESNEQRFAA